MFEEPLDQMLENAVEFGLQQMPLVALKRAVDACNNTPDHILLSGGICDNLKKTY